MWYISKARNNLVFENSSENPQDTLDKAIREEEVWRHANTRDPMVEETMVHVAATSFQDSPICYIDGSWHDREHISGHGWLTTNDTSILYIGLKGSRESLSPLHAKLDTLLWAIDYLLKLGMDSMHFAKDCLDFIAMTSNIDDWPAIEIVLMFLV
ncbi:uncharacterized protein LOC111830444 [Capsella rubella]|uniref:uncharacterized protein LOC111830444 n=1 Tax=Capsella rubella TaxID=81985 RepID=UPI000CD4D5D3|nr:uncharacterized protein LOC111830444 [Capsella rubella]